MVYWQTHMPWSFPSQTVCTEFLHPTWHVVFILDVVFIHVRSGSLSQHLGRGEMSSHSWWCHALETITTLLNFVRRIHQSQVVTLTKGQCGGALMFLWCCMEKLFEQTGKLPVIWDTLTLTKGQCGRALMFLWCCMEKLFEQTGKLPVIWDTLMLMWQHWNVAVSYKNVIWSAKMYSKSLK